MIPLSFLVAAGAILSIIVSPFMALRALRRTSALEKELAEAREAQKMLSEHVDRLQNRSQEMQTLLERLQTGTASETAETPSAAKAAGIEQSEIADAADEPQAPIEDDGSDEAQPDVAETPDERQETDQARDPAVAAARIVSPWDATVSTPSIRSVNNEDQGSEDEEATGDEPEYVVVAPEEENQFEEPVFADAPAATVGSAHKVDLEQRLSTNWLVWVGGVSLAIAGIFLVRYLAEQGWLSPAMRCAIGVTVGLALVAAGEFVRRQPPTRAIAAMRPDYVPQALTAAGLLTAFGSVYLAYAFYDLLPSGWSFVTLAGIALSAFGLSLVQGGFVALLGLAGAVATPALVSTQNPSSWGFFTYLGIVVLATLAVADRRRWNWLPELSLIATAGWAALWLQTQFREPDILPIGVTLGVVALGGLLLAWRRRADVEEKQDGQSRWFEIELHVVATTGVVIAAGGVFALAIRSDFLPVVHWLFLTYLLVAVLIPRILPQFEWILPGLTILAIVSFGLVYVDESALANLAERLWGTPAPTDYFAEKYERFRLHAGLVAIVAFVGGLATIARAAKPISIVIVTGATPLAFLLIGYAQFRNFSGDAIWVWASVANVIAAIAATGYLDRRRKLHSDVPGLYAAFAVIAALLALTFQFDRVWLTLSYAGLVLVLAVTSMRRDFSQVRQLANLIVLLVLARLTLNPDLRGYEIFHPLGMQWVSYGYLVPLTFFVVASRLLKRTKDDLTVSVLEGASLLLGIVFVSIEIRIYMTGSIYSGEYSLPEASLQTIAWLTSALILARRNQRYPRMFSTWGSRILTGAGALQAMVLQLVLMNPIFTGDLIDGYGIFNMLILSLAAPAILLWLIAGSSLTKNASLNGQVGMTLRACSGLLIFAFVTEEVRVVFQGMLIRPLHVSLLELYITTLAWLLPASLPYLILAKGAAGHARRISEAVLVVSLLMLVIGHALIFNPVVTGEVVRGFSIVNTLLVGFLLPVSVLYAVAGRTTHVLRGMFLGGAYLLLTTWVWLSVKHAFQGARLAVLHDSLLELYLTTLAWILLAMLPFYFRRIGEMAEAKRAGYAVLAVSTLMLFAGHSVVFNPVYDASFVPGPPVFNVLLLGFILPAAFVGFIAGKIDPNFKSMVQAAAFVLLFIGITMIVKHAFQGGIMTIETLSDMENYGYSAAWLILALATMVAGIRTDNSRVRYASLTVLLLVVIKVFLLDMASLAGLWRVASFFGLGISLVGIGYVYQRFIYGKQLDPEATVANLKET